MTKRLPDDSFWKNKKVLVTGHSGFKGSWLVIWLNKLGAKVSGISLTPETKPNLFTEANIEKICHSQFIDIRNLEKVKAQILSIQPQIIIHMAAQPLVRESYKSPISTFETNVIGTVNILESIQYCNSVEAAILITTDKVYKNNEDGKPYSEDDQLGGHDPYSASKAAAEIVIESYKKSFFDERNISISSARAGNVIGGGDWSKDRLIPDLIRSWQTNSTLNVRNPDSVRPWQHVLEPLAGYLFLAEDTFQNLELCGPYNFGPCKKDIGSVKDVVTIADSHLGLLDIDFLDENNGPHEANLLFLDTYKSNSILNFEPSWDMKESVLKTTNWYKSYYEDNSALSLCELDIIEFEASLA